MGFWSPHRIVPNKPDSENTNKAAIEGSNVTRDPRFDLL